MHNIPSDSSQRKVLKAFKKIGFEILPSGFGKGSHRLVKDLKTGVCITIQRKIYKQVLESYCKRVEELGYSAEEFARRL